MRLGRKRLKERELGSPARVKGETSPTLGETNDYYHISWRQV
jgi:hypothetical protein